MLPTLHSGPLATNARNPAAVYLASLAPTGRRAIAGRLKTVAAILGVEPDSAPWAAIRYEHVAHIKARLIEDGRAPATVNQALAAIRGVARAAFNLEQMSAEDYQRIRSVTPARGSRLPKGRALSSGELAASMEACTTDQTLAGYRDSALVAVMYAAGLRRAEVVSLNLDHYTPETGEIWIKGKGNKERLLYINNGAAEALGDWVKERGGTSGAMFLPINKGGKISGERMTEQAVYNILRKRAAQAGVKAFSPHDLRRTFASDLLDRDADIATVQKLMGHANVTTTANYDRRGEQAKRKASGLLHVPYRRTHAEAR